MAPTIHRPSAIHQYWIYGAITVKIALRATPMTGNCFDQPHNPIIAKPITPNAQTPPMQIKNIRMVIPIMQTIASPTISQPAIAIQ